MIIIILILSMVGWLCVSMVFEAGYQALKPAASGKLQKHQWCWIFWSALGVLSFATGGAGGLVQGAIIFVIAAGHISACGVKEDAVSPVEIVRNIGPALREVYARFRRI
jgi:hypothetical protein